MKKGIIAFILVFSVVFSMAQSSDTATLFRNIEVFYSPFQTRIGGLEYDRTITNKDNWLDLQTDANVLRVNNIEIGANYLFKIKELNFGAGVSYYTDEFKFFIITELQNKIHRINRNGLSLNLFYRQQIFSGTTLDLGLNTRFPLISNRYNFNDFNWSQEIISTRNVLVFENWVYKNLIEFVPSVQFNSVIYKNLYVKYGMLAKFWGNELYSARATEKYGNQDVLLDFSLKSTTFKATFSVGYSF